MTELLPCPFCQGTDISTCQGEIGKIYFMRCKDCRAEGPTSMYGEDAAIEQWNTRPSPWRDISSAPKDGTRVHLYYPDPIFTGISAIYGDFDNDKYAKKPVPHWRHDLHNISGRTSTKNNQPTHWQPLPSPPKED